MENQLLITLSRNKLLKNADISKISMTGVRGRLITIGEGEILYREGDIADIIYLITSGEINILKKRLLGKTKSFIFSENDFFGHEEFFEETARTSTAVALRDSYLIALSREEIEALIQQDDEILINLREPVAEIDEEMLSANNVARNSSDQIKNAEPSPSSDLHWTSTAETKSNNIIESSKDEEPNPQEFFKSIADISRTKEENIIHPIDNFTSSTELTPAPIKEFTFDENAFLNEDGIPKADVELPEEPTNARITRPTTELNDALFNILSGNTSSFEPSKKINDSKPEVKESDDAFFQSFGLKDEPIVSRKPLTGEIPPQNEIPILEVEQSIPELHEEEIAEPEAPITIEDFGPETVFGEEEKIIEEIKKPEVSEEVFNQPPFQVNSSMFDSQMEEEMNADELQMIIKAAELVNSTIHVDEVLKNIIDVAKDLTHSDRGTLYLVDNEKGELWSLITLGDEMREIRLKIGEGLAGFVAKSGETINIKDVRKDSRFKADFDRESGYTTKNMICFPIKNNKGNIVGVLQLLNSANGEFTKRDEEFLAALSIHSAIALNNAELVEKLLQGERVHSLGKMANFLIQDIKKPVLVSKRYAEHLRTKSLPPDAVQVLDMLLDQLNQVADLVQTTSSYSEGKPILRMLNVSLNSTLSDYASRVEQLVGSRNCQIQNEFDKDVTVKLDVKEFFQTYQHIVKNACDAMPDGGKIIISTKRADKKVEISFKDNGLGISDGFKEKIFEPFMTLGKKEGTGLGLAITKKIIEAHDGTINVQSALGEGATFMITLPIASAF
ncbi:MAG: ATP-binding protein [Ignavibacteriales bacterium]|nr:ATP-binding protein [Ignavibacteriales bacterium]